MARYQNNQLGPCASR